MKKLEKELQEESKLKAQQIPVKQFQDVSVHCLSVKSHKKVTVGYSSKYRKLCDFLLLANGRIEL